MLPIGYVAVNRGLLQFGDLLWDEVFQKWLPVTTSQVCVGYPVKDFKMVIRKVELDSLFVKKLFDKKFTLEQVEDIVECLDSTCKVCYRNDVPCYCASCYDE